MRSTGLELQTVLAACMVEAGRLLPGDHGDSICVGNLQPDLVLSRYWTAGSSIITRNCLLQLASGNYAPTGLRLSWRRAVGGKC
jgi:hypothetical protein